MATDQRLQRLALAERHPELNDSSLSAGGCMVDSTLPTTMRGPAILLKREGEFRRTKNEYRNGCAACPELST
jgi:hypothetical protein